MHKCNAQEPHESAQEPAHKHALAPPYYVGGRASTACEHTSAALAKAVIHSQVSR